MRGLRPERQVQATQIAAFGKRFERTLEAGWIESERVEGIATQVARQCIFVESRLEEFTRQHLSIESRLDEFQSIVQDGVKRMEAQLYELAELGAQIDALTACVEDRLDPIGMQGTSIPCINSVSKSATESELNIWQRQRKRG